MKSIPFKRAIMMMSAISAAVSAGMSHALAAASVGEYRSRGKGRSGHSGKKLGPPSSNRNMHVVDGRWLQIENGKREVARRQRNMARGMENAEPFNKGFTINKDGWGSGWEAGPTYVIDAKS